MNKLEKELASLRGMGDYERIPGGKRLPELKTTITKEHSFLLFGKPLSAYSYDEAYGLLSKSCDGRNLSIDETTEVFAQFQREWVHVERFLTYSHAPLGELEPNWLDPKIPSGRTACGVNTDFPTTPPPVYIGLGSMPADDPARSSALNTARTEGAGRILFDNSINSIVAQHRADTTGDVNDAVVAEPGVTPTPASKISYIYTSCPSCNLNFVLTFRAGLIVPEHTRRSRDSYDTKCPGSGQLVKTARHNCQDCGKKIMVLISGDRWRVYWHLKRGRQCTGSQVILE